uniref:protein FAR-RED ELONGATED HYPOCOTYL 3-like n=1 Tax=Erigeron canadensis TaxID=72917 RepID=UPI001CB9A49B|nr:protein FAR-RED ELONGATED HYPOCOTYL 3-like [Erigeron canadensis]
MDDFKAELLNKNPGSVVEIDFEKKGDKKHFKRFFISLAACSKGFLAGCRPYIGLDACHLKGKYNGVLAAATGIDGNNSIFLVAYSVLESEITASWTWFLESLKRAIGTPDGLVISSDMQKGLEVAIKHVYPNVEHRECIRHLYSNFKKHFRGDFFYSNLWGAALTYHSSEHDRFMKQIAGLRENAITYLTQNHNKIWSRSKFGTISKCDYITNNISEAFNSWIGKLRYKPVLDLVDSIREKMIKRFDKKRRIVKKWNGTLVPKAKSYLNQISKNLGEYKVSRTGDTQAKVTYKTKRYEVNLLETKCSCRLWQVKGLPCVHATALIAFTRDSDWDKYVDPYFSIEKFKEAYALDFGTIFGKDQWVHIDTEEKIYPPIIKRPPGRPKKNRIVSRNEPKRRSHKCPRCGQFGHREKTCNNASSQSSDQYETSEAHNNKRRRGKKRKAHENGAD